MTGKTDEGSTGVASARPTSSQSSYTLNTTHDRHPCQEPVAVIVSHNMPSAKSSSADGAKKKLNSLSSVSSARRTHPVGRADAQLQTMLKFPSLPSSTAYQKKSNAPDKKSPMLPPPPGVSGKGQRPAYPLSSPGSDSSSRLASVPSKGQAATTGKTEQKPSGLDGDITPKLS